MINVRIVRASRSVERKGLRHCNGEKGGEREKGGAYFELEIERAMVREPSKALKALGEMVFFFYKKIITQTVEIDRTILGWCRFNMG